MKCSWWLVVTALGAASFGRLPTNHAQQIKFPVKFRHLVPVDWFPKGATPEGVFQMAGNSAEWCSDYFDHGHA